MPAEVKNQLRFPKAMAMSKENLRYLERVRKEVHSFIASNISHNYVTGEKDITLDSTLQEIEVLYNANPEVKAMAETGQLTEIHQKVHNLAESSKSEYKNIRDRLNNIVSAVQSKEDEIYKEAMHDYPDLKLSLHASDMEFSFLFSSRAFIST